MKKRYIESQKVKTDYADWLEKAEAFKIIDIVDDIYNVQNLVFLMALIVCAAIILFA